MGLVLGVMLLVGGYALFYQWGYFGAQEDKARLNECQNLENELADLTDKCDQLQTSMGENEEFFAQMSQLYDIELLSTEEAGVGGPIIGIDANLLQDSDISAMAELYNMLSVGEINSDQVFSSAEKKYKIWGSTPSLLPTEGGISSGFGWRINPLSGGAQFHTGVDINCTLGTPIYASADGVVIKAGMTGGYGLEVRLKHGFGFSTLYGHCSQIFVTEGQEVKRGDLIAAVGATGWATGNHLHYEVRINNVPVDPMGYIVTGYLVD